MKYHTWPGLLGIGLLVVGFAVAAEDKKDERFAPFSIGVQSYTFREFDLEQCLKRIQDLGLHHAEFYQKHIPLESSPEQINAILKTCKTLTLDDIAQTSPLLDIWQGAQDRLYSRLFQS